jgi:hypothetical protein
VGSAGSDTIIDGLANNTHVGGNIAKLFTWDFLRQVLQQWADGRSQNSRFILGLTDDDTVDSLFDGLGGDWFIVSDGDLRTDLNSSDHDLITAV